MGQAGKLSTILLGSLVTVSGCSATGAVSGQEVTPLPPVPVALGPPASPTPPVTPELPAIPSAQPDERPLPINLPTALQLANVRAVDIAAASQRIQAAAAVLEQARVLWLPTVTLGADYYHHDGPIQDVSNTVYNDNHNSLLLGAGSGIGQAAVLSVNDAIFAPLYARQQVRTQQAALQAASNDTLVAVSDAYFTVQQGRGELAGASEATRRIEDLVARTRKLAPGIVAELELFRAETELASRQKTELLARERWQVASAELVRLLRLDPSAQVEPAEPPQLQVELIDLQQSVDDLIRVGLTYRPELASQQAQVQATLTLLKQERLRPLIPSVLLRGASTNPGGTLAGGFFLPAPFSSTSGLRDDVDLQLLWQLDNLGFGNVGKVHQRQAENKAALVELFRLQDLVARDVAQAYAQAQQAARRVAVAERGLRFAQQSADKNLAALKEVKGVGNQLVLLVRPQEVVAAIQALAQAYMDYYGAIADVNRAQFRLYRALGQPAQYLMRDEQRALLCGADLPPAATLGSPVAETSSASRPLPGDTGQAGACVAPK